MIPAIAFMLAAYTAPRIVIATMQFVQSVPATHNGSRAFAMLLCVFSLGGIALGLMGVFLSGVTLPKGL